VGDEVEAGDEEAVAAVDQQLLIFVLEQISHRATMMVGVLSSLVLVVLVLVAM
jgi:hypothetical protein